MAYPGMQPGGGLMGVQQLLQQRSPMQGRRAAGQGMDPRQRFGRGGRFPGMQRPGAGLGPIPQPMPGAGFQPGGRPPAPAAGTGAGFLPGARPAQPSGPPPQQPQGMPAGWVDPGYSGYGEPPANVFAPYGAGQPPQQGGGPMPMPMPDPRQGGQGGQFQPQGQEQFDPIIEALQRYRQGGRGGFTPL